MEIKNTRHSFYTRVNYIQEKCLLQERMKIYKMFTSNTGNIIMYKKTLNIQEMNYQLQGKKKCTRSMGPVIRGFMFLPLYSVYKGLKIMSLYRNLSC